LRDGSTTTGLEVNLSKKYLNSLKLTASASSYSILLGCVGGEDVWGTELHTLVEECSLGHSTGIG